MKVTHFDSYGAFRDSKFDNFKNMGLVTINKNDRAFAGFLFKFNSASKTVTMIGEIFGFPGMKLREEISEGMDGINSVIMFDMIKEYCNQLKILHFGTDIHAADFIEFFTASMRSGTRHDIWCIRLNRELPAYSANTPFEI